MKKELDHFFLDLFGPLLALQLYFSRRISIGFFSARPFGPIACHCDSDAEISGPWKVAVDRDSLLAVAGNLVADNFDSFHRIGSGFDYIHRIGVVGIAAVHIGVGSHNFRSPVAGDVHIAGNHIADSVVRRDYSDYIVADFGYRDFVHGIDHIAPADFDSDPGSKT